MTSRKKSTRKCEECGDKVSGRSDKRFCSDQCRTQFNNRLNKDVTQMMRNINNLLRRNRRILSKLNPRGKTKVSRSRLIEEGFNFGYFTNEYKTKSGNIYRFCYEQGYLQLQDEVYALVHKKDYIK